MKDETLSHVPLFMNIFRTIITEEFNGIIPVELEYKITTMVTEMANAEKRWSKYALEDIPGSSDRSIDLLVEAQANSVCKNLGVKTIYEKSEFNPLKKLLIANLKGGELPSRTNFFTGNVTEYSKGSLELDL